MCSHRLFAKALSKASYVANLTKARPFERPVLRSVNKFTPDTLVKELKKFSRSC
jgi:hypothetical protein